MLVCFGASDRFALLLCSALLCSALLPSHLCPPSAGAFSRLFGSCSEAAPRMSNAFVSKFTVCSALLCSAKDLLQVAQMGKGDEPTSRSLQLASQLSSLEAVSRRAKTSGATGRRRGLSFAPPRRPAMLRLQAPRVSRFLAPCTTIHDAKQAKQTIDDADGLL